MSDASSRTRLVHVSPEGPRGQHVAPGPVSMVLVLHRRRGHRRRPVPVLGRGCCGPGRSGHVSVGGGSVGPHGRRVRGPVEGSVVRGSLRRGVDVSPVVVGGRRGQGGGVVGAEHADGGGAAAETGPLNGRKGHVRILIINLKTDIAH